MKKDGKECFAFLDMTFMFETCQLEKISNKNMLRRKTKSKRSTKSVDLTTTKRILYILIAGNSLTFCILAKGKKNIFRNCALV